MLPLLAFSITEWSLLLVFTGVYLWKHAHVTTPWAVRLATFIGWFMGFSIIAILPLDILVTTNKKTDEIITGDEREVAMRGLTVVWAVFYWTAFVMCWAVLPLMMNYVQTGEFTVRGKLQRAVKEQARYYMIIGSIGLFMLVYLWYKSAFER